MTTSPDIERAVSVVELGIKACEAYGRQDLASRLEDSKERLTDTGVHVLVIGEFKQGKSSLVNALANARICPVDDDIATAVPTFLHHGDQPSAAVAYEQPGATSEDPPGTVRESISIEEIHNYVTEQKISQTRKIHAVEIWLPRKILEGGLVVVDTPGVGGLGSVHATATMGAIPLADAVIFTSDASQEYTKAELEFLKQAIDVCPNVVCVQTKIDFYPSWRKIVEINKGHLERAGINCPILPVSATLRVEAVRANDRELNQESGYPALVKWIDEQVGAAATAQAVGAVAAEVLGTADQLEQQFLAEKAALSDPANAQSVIDELNATKEQTERLRGQAAKWNQTLADGIQDLGPDTDHDFRARIRRILAECDAALENSDPADTWTEFEPWLYNRVSHEVVQNYTFLRTRAGQLSEEVGQHFREASGEVLDQFAVYNPVPVIGSTDAQAELEFEKMGVGSQSFNALRGGYIGVLMFSALGSFAGLAVAPFLVAPIGLIMGRKQLKDEKQRQLTQRRNQAKNTIRKYCDEVSFTVQKDSRDTLRRVQRQLRDHYSARAEELHKSTNEALMAATEAAKRNQSESQKRLRDIDAEIERLTTLRKRAAGLTSKAKVG